MNSSTLPLYGCLMKLGGGLATQEEVEEEAVVYTHF